MQKKHLQLACSTALITLLLGGLILEFTQPDSNAFFEEPSPNGYSSFLDASIVAILDNRIYQSDETILRSIVKLNEVAIQHALNGLRIPSRVMFEQDHQESASRITFMNRFVRVLIIRAQLLASDGETERAFDAYLNAFRFATESTRGGNLAHYQSWAGQKIKILREFRKFIPQMDSTQSNEFLQFMNTIDNDEDNSFDRVSDRHHAWLNRAYGPRWRLDMINFHTTQAWNKKSLAPLFLLFKKPVYLETRYQTDHAIPVRDLLKKQIQDYQDASTL